MKIKKNDTVKILAGKDRGKSGKVIKIYTKQDRILIDGVNIFKKHVRPKREGEKGEVVQIVRPINISNVNLICSNCHKTTRVSYRFENGKKIRFCKKCSVTT